MKIIVCIKQVPKVEQVRFDPRTNNLLRENVESIINPPDKQAIEAALCLREKTGGTIAVVTMGPSQAQDALREAMAMGCDEAYLLSDRAFAGADTLATTAVLAAAIRKIGESDLIVCGSHSLDADTGQVGPQLAERLDIPQVTYVRTIEQVQNKQFPLRFEREIEDGIQKIQSPLPVLISIADKAFTPRIPNAIAIMKAAKKEITAWSNAELKLEESEIGAAGSPTGVRKLFKVEKKRASKIFTGDAGEMVDSLLVELETKGRL